MRYFLLPRLKRELKLKARLRRRYLQQDTELTKRLSEQVRLYLKEVLLFECTKRRCKDLCKSKEPEGESEVRPTLAFCGIKA